MTLLPASPTPTWRRALAASMLSTLALLTACGGGGTSTPSSGSASGQALGTVTGFGSVIVDGVRYDDRSARLSIDTESGAPDDRGGTVTVKLGQRVTLEFSGSDDSPAAGRVAVSAEVVGRVSAIAPDLVIAGQIVRTNEDAATGPVTVYEGFASKADIQVADRAEVHGTPSLVNGQIVIQASRIERKPTADAWIRVAGSVGNLASDGSRFSLGGLTVQVDTRAGGTRIVPASGTLANGQRVVVWSTGAAVNNSVTASIVRIQRGQTQGSQEIRLSGPITDCTAPCAGSFKVGGTPVKADGSGVDFRNGTAADLANGRWVEIRGSLDAAGQTLVATRVSLRERDSSLAQTRLRGSISDYVDAANFKVRGVPVTTDSATRIGTGCPSPLANGTLVEVLGRITPTQVLATSITCFAASDGFTVEAKGSIATVDAAARSFTFSAGSGSLESLTVKWDDSTSFDDGTAAQLAAGRRVEVKGTISAGVLTARSIEFEDAPSSAGILESEGVVSTVTTSGTTITGFTLGGKSFVVTPQTVFVPGPTALVAGAEVKVLFRQQADVATATWVRVKRGG